MKLENIEVCHWGHVLDLKGMGQEHVFMFQYFLFICYMGEPRNMFFFLNNKILYFHDLFTFTESIDNQRPLLNLS